MEYLFTFIKTNSGLVTLFSVLILVAIFRFSSVYKKRKKQEQEVFMENLKDLDIRRLMYKLVLPSNIKLQGIIVETMKTRVQENLETAIKQGSVSSLDSFSNLLCAIVMISHHDKNGAYNKKEICGLFDNASLDKLLNFLFQIPADSLKDLFIRKDEIQKMCKLNFFSVKNRIEFRGILSEEDGREIVRKIDKYFAEVVTQHLILIGAERFRQEYEPLGEDNRNIIIRICENSHLEDHIRIFSDASQYQFA